MQYLQKIEKLSFEYKIIGPEATPDGKENEYSAAIVSRDDYEQFVGGYVYRDLERNR